MRVKVIPHGALRQSWPTDFECEASTPAEVMTALTSQFNLGRPSTTGRWTVALVGYNSQASLYCPLTTRELHVVPSLHGGGGGGGFFKIALGAVLIAVSFAIPGVLGVTLTSIAFNLGASLVLGGILEFLSPAPKSNKPNSVSQNQSEYLGAPKNTTASGTPIQIGYGRFPIFGQFLSFNIETDPAPVTLAGSAASPTSAEYRRGTNADGYRYDAGESAGEGGRPSAVEPTSGGPGFVG